MDERSAQQAVARLLAALSQAGGEEVPATALGRLRRTAGAAARMGGAHLLGRLRGNGDADLEAVHRLVVSLGQLKGVAMKLGQLLSYLETSMPPELRELLAVLQKNSQPTPFTSIERVLREELGASAEALLARLERAPVATASIGQVHRATLEDGRAVAVKVQHPNISEAIRADFRSAQTGKTLVKLFAPSANAAAMIDEAERMFLEECDYRLELRRQQQFAGLYAGDADVSIPAAHPEWSSDKVLTTEWRDGLGWERFLEVASPAAKDHAGEALYRFYVGTVYRHGLFNGDPHPGNLLFDPDGRLTVLDFGCVREFDPATVEALKRLSVAVRADDAVAMRSAFVALGAKEPKGAVELETIRRLLRGFFGPVLVPGKRRVRADDSFELREVLRDKRAMLQLRIPAQLLFLFRIRFGLHSLLARLGAEADWSALEAEAAGNVGPTR